MKLITFSIICVLALPVFSNDPRLFFNISSDYPPKEWWGEKTSFKEVEQGNEDFFKPIFYSIYSSECIKWLPDKSTKSRVVRRDCAESKKLSELELDKKYVKHLKANALIHNKEWKKFKLMFKENDSILTYGAPPISGGYGTFILRNGRPVAYYEHGSQ